MIQWGKAVDHVRGGNGPAIVEVESYRWFGHSTADAGVYRTKEEVDEWKNNNDPIIRYRDYLVSENIASVEELDAIQSQVKAQVDAAYEFCPKIAQIQNFQLPLKMYG